MQEARNDEKIEKSEQEKRLQNFIIHGAEEIGDDAEAIKKNDEEYIKDILKKLGVKAEAESATRLGQPNEAKMRTLKIVMKTEAEKEEVMRNLRKLKGTEDAYTDLEINRIMFVHIRTLVRTLSSWLLVADASGSSLTFLTIFVSI